MIPLQSHQLCSGDCRARFGYAAAWAVSVCLGLASRRYASSLPPFIAEYAGDTIWAAMAFCGLSMLFVRKPLPWRAGVAVAFCYAIEASQLYHAPRIDRIRQTTLGGLVLGRGFLASDLACYAVGVIVAAAVDASVRRQSNRKTNESV